jgi:hypothetical protein
MLHREKTVADTMKAVEALRLGDRVYVKTDAAKPWSADWPANEEHTVVGLRLADGKVDVTIRSDDDPGCTDGFGLDDLSLVTRPPASTATADGLAGALEGRIVALEKNSHPPVDLLPAIQEEVARLLSPKSSDDEQVIAERDAAEDALSAAFALVTGREPEWSNLFGYPEALAEMREATTVPRPASLEAAGSGGVVQAVRKVRDGYASQAKFCDIEALPYFREFIRRIDVALSACEGGHE